jgi:hypothetical protein
MQAGLHALSWTMVRVGLGFAAALFAVLMAYTLVVLFIVALQVGASWGQ